MVTMVSVTLGDAVRRYRLQAGMSQESLAEISGVERSYISMIENGHRNPSYEIVAALTGAMGIPPSVIYRAAEVEMPVPSDPDDAFIIRVDDAKLAASLRRLLRLGADRVFRIERAARELYDRELDEFIDAVPEESPDRTEGAQGAGC